MAEPNLNPEEQALRRRARRRLVGALAIALLAIVVLPMVFDPEPKPLGDDVDIVIPGQETPFTNAPPAQPVTIPETVPAIETPIPVMEAPSALEPEMVTPKSPAPVKQPEKKHVQAKTEPPKAKPVAPVTKKEAPAKPKEAEPKAKEEAPKAAPERKATHYTLQLGAFSTEANATQLVDRAKLVGLSAVVVKEQGQYKVRAGAYDSHEKAVEAQASLKAKGLSPIVVGP